MHLYNPAIFNRPEFDSAQIAELKRIINGASKVAITCHICPDGDALGSTLALCRVLRQLGKQATVITPDLITQNLAWLPGAGEIVDGNRYAEKARNIFAQADAVFCLDFNARSRIDRLQRAMEGATCPIVMIDHHLEPEMFATITLSYPHMSSTCLLLYYVLQALDLGKFLNGPTASLILTGMMTDTGNFAYNASDPAIYPVIGDLVAAGADKEALYRRLFNTFSESNLRLNGFALAEKMEVFHSQHAALITLSRDELNRFHYSKGDTEGLVNKPLSIPGVLYSCFLREEERYIKVSMRSLGSFPVDRMCADHFGGGGHRNAAGGEFYGTLDECAQLFRRIVPEYTARYITNSDNK